MQLGSVQYNFWHCAHSQLCLHAPEAPSIGESQGSGYVQTHCSVMLCMLCSERGHNGVPAKGNPQLVGMACRRGGSSVFATLSADPVPGAS